MRCCRSVTLRHSRSNPPSARSQQGGVCFQRIPPLPQVRVVSDHRARRLHGQAGPSAVRPGRVSPSHHPASLPPPRQQAAAPTSRRVQQGMGGARGGGALSRAPDGSLGVCVCVCSWRRPAGAAGRPFWSWPTLVAETTWGRCFWGSFAPSSTLSRSVQNQDWSGGEEAPPSSVTLSLSCRCLTCPS